ncbi:PIN domain-containing protein [Allochromatium warmingii]|uniref:PIN domain-containing protein n=1 Tax=Allochromatium warmingii TaxID=61595 RepID=UPI000B880EB0
MHRHLSCSRYRALELNRYVFEHATELRAQHRLATPDALHLAAAIDAGCEEFWTNDRRLEHAAAGLLAVVTFTDNARS